VGPGGAFAVIANVPPVKSEEIADEHAVAPNNAGRAHHAETGLRDGRADGDRPAERRETSGR
jgi:hypothetical protein